MCIIYDITGYSGSSIGRSSSATTGPGWPGRGRYLSSWSGRRCWYRFCCRCMLLYYKYIHAPTVAPGNHSAKGSQQNKNILGSKTDLLSGDCLDAVYSFMQRGVIVTEQQDDAFLQSAMSEEEQQKFAFYLDQPVFDMVSCRA